MNRSARYCQKFQRDRTKHRCGLNLKRSHRLVVEATQNHHHIHLIIAIDISTVRARARVRIGRLPVRIRNQHRHTPVRAVVEANQNTQTKTKRRTRKKARTRIDHRRRTAKRKMKREMARKNRLHRNIGRQVTNVVAIDQARPNVKRKVSRQAARRNAIWMHWCTKRTWKKTTSRHNAEWFSKNSTRKPSRRPMLTRRHQPVLTKRTIRWPNMTIAPNESGSLMKMLRASINHRNHPNQVQIMFKMRWRYVHSVTRQLFPLF